MRNFPRPPFPPPPRPPDTPIWESCDIRASLSLYGFEGFSLVRQFTPNFSLVAGQAQPLTPLETPWGFPYFRHRVQGIRQWRDPTDSHSIPPKPHRKMNSSKPPKVLLTNRVKEFKTRFMLTSQVVSTLTGIPVGTIEGLSCRRRHVPTPETLLALSKIFQLNSPLELLKWVGPSPNDP